MFSCISVQALQCVGVDALHDPGREEAIEEAAGPGGQHPRRMALPPPRRHHVVPDMAARLSQFRAKPVADDKRAQVELT